MKGIWKIVRSRVKKKESVKSGSKSNIRAPTYYSNPSATQIPAATLAYDPDTCDSWPTMPVARALDLAAQTTFSL